MFSLFFHGLESMAMTTESPINYEEPRRTTRSHGGNEEPAITLVGEARATGLVHRVSAWIMYSVTLSFFVWTRVPPLFFLTSMKTSPLKARTMLL